MKKLFMQPITWVAVLIIVILVFPSTTYAGGSFFEICYSLDSSDQALQAEFEKIVEDLSINAKFTVKWPSGKTVSLDINGTNEIEGWYDKSKSHVYSTDGEYDSINHRFVFFFNNKDDDKAYTDEEGTVEIISLPIPKGYKLTYDSQLTQGKYSGNDQFDMRIDFQKDSSTAPTTPTQSQDIKILINNETVPVDQAPINKDGRILVPVRAISEALGASVRWDEAIQTVFITKSYNDNERVVSMTIGASNIYINDEGVSIDVPPQIINGRTLIPLRALAEALGATVTWNGETRTVIVED